MSYLILFDIKELDNATRLRVNRKLRKLSALMLQQSVWESNNVDELRELVESIRLSGGKALILEKRVVG
ncbi:MAG: hypothetical protein U9M97_04170 [Candidatus Hadarchaeota archaeon]|nr:hypothetical protein [Candidatus Hadarchaeota archaeon]